MLYDFSINLKIAENKNACLLFRWPKGSRSGEDQDQEHANHFSTIRGLCTKKLIPQCKSVNTVLHCDRFWSVLLFSRNSWNCGVFAVVCQPRIHQKVHFFHVHNTSNTIFKPLSSYKHEFMWIRNSEIQENTLSAIYGKNDCLDRWNKKSYGFVNLKLRDN